VALFRGLSAFPITPTTADGSVIEADYARVISRLVGAGVGSIAALGSTGTYPYLARDQRRRAIARAVAEAGPIPVMAGIGALRTDDVMAFADDAQAAGAAAVLLAPVSYLPLTEDEVFGLFETVSSGLSVPVCVYDNPATTHFSFGDELLARVCSLPQVAAVKLSSPPPESAALRLAELRALLPKTSIGFSVDWNATETLVAGGDAWYSVLAGLFPVRAMEIVDAVEAADPQNAREVAAGLEPLWDLFRRLSSLRVTYAAAALLGLTTAEPPLPVAGLRADERLVVERTLREVGLFD
jgi:4-hydroxy-tetrahydrodipicolinate synthase